MLTPSPFSWLSQTTYKDDHKTATNPAISRRTFTNSSLAATALAALPARSLWAEVSKPSTIPAQLDAVGLTGKPVTSMQRELQKALTLEEVATAASRNFGRVFGSQMLWLESLDDLLAQAEAAPDIEADKVPANQDTPVRLPKELRELHGDGSEIV